MKRIFLVLAIILAIIGNSKILAAENGGLFLSPPFTDISLDIKQPEKAFYLEIGNNTYTETVFDISVVDFGSLDETGGVAFLTVNNDKNERKYSLASWISLEKQTVTVMPGKTEKIKVTILNKDSLSPGGHYGAVLATVRTAADKVKDMVGINQSLASLIYVQKTGGEKPNLIFKSWEFSKNIFYFPKTVKIRFENNGNVHVVPRGKVEIKNSQGEIIAKGIINGDSGKILPESFRIMELPIENKVRRWNRPGIYNMDVSYRFDGRDEFLSMKTKVIYVGFEGVLVVSGLALITALIVTLILRKIRR